MKVTFNCTTHLNCQKVKMKLFDFLSVTNENVLKFMTFKWDGILWREIIPFHANDVHQQNAWWQAKNRLQFAFFANFIKKANNVSPNITCSCEILSFWKFSGLKRRVFSYLTQNSFWFYVIFFFNSELAMQIPK